MCEVLTIVKDVSNVILESAKRKGMYMDIVLVPCDGGSNLKVQRLPPLCPTRWAVRAKSSRFQENYERVYRTLEDILGRAGALADSRRAALIGFSKRMKRFDTVFFLNAAIKVFGPCELLARALQSPQYSAGVAKKAAQMLEKTLSDLRTQDSLDRIFKATECCVQGMHIEMSDPPQRMRKAPRRFEATDNAAALAQLTSDEKLRQEFYVILDRLINEVKKRFTQSGFDTLVRLEEILNTSAARSSPSFAILKQQLRVHDSDFDLERRHAQLLMLPSIIDLQQCNVHSTARRISVESSVVRDLMDKVGRLFILILTVPASAASSEGSLEVFGASKHTYDAQCPSLG
ncbi:hypothetical protein MTO96_046207 [Rhipicephalus appendiculatus]